MLCGPLPKPTTLWTVAEADDQLAVSGTFKRLMLQAETMSLDPEAEQVAESTTADQVESLATELGEAIAALPEYEEFLDAKAEVEADEDAQDRIREFEEIRNEYVQARQSGQASQEDLLELQRAQEHLHDLPVMSDFLQAQNSLELRLQAINEAVSEPLAIDFGEKAGGCCQD